MELYDGYLMNRVEKEERPALDEALTEVRF